MAILPILLMIFMEILVISWIYRPIDKLALLANISIHGFVLPGSLLLLMILKWDGFLVFIPLLLLQAIGYKIFLHGSWGKALLAAVSSTVAAFLIAYIVSLFIHF
jgi:hypothetical protein